MQLGGKRQDLPGLEQIPNLAFQTDPARTGSEQEKLLSFQSSSVHSAASPAPLALTPTLRREQRGKRKPFFGWKGKERPWLPAVVLPAGQPEGAVAAVAVRGQVVGEPSRHLWETEPQTEQFSN